MPFLSFPFSSPFLSQSDQTRSPEKKNETGELKKGKTKEKVETKTKRKKRGGWVVASLVGWVGGWWQPNKTKQGLSLSSLSPSGRPGGATTTYLVVQSGRNVFFFLPDALLTLALLFVIVIIIIIITARHTVTDRRMDRQDRQMDRQTDSWTDRDSPQPTA